jgi:hypothetical protein
MGEWKNCFFGRVMVLGVLALLALPLSAEERGLEVVAAETVGTDAAVGRQWAVFIAIDRYQEWRPLGSPVRDAQEIRNILREQYFIDEVRECYDREATAANIRRLLGNLRNEVLPNDSVFVFYAGHGYTDDLTNTGFWIPADAGRDTYVQNNWLPNIQVRNLLSALPAKHVFLISDACFSGDILDTNRGPTPEITNAYFRRAYSRVSRQVMTSGASENVPDSSEFALRLKSALRRAESSCVDPEYLFTIVREVQSTQPMLGVIRGSEHQEGGSFLFFRRPAVTAVAPVQPKQVPPQQTRTAPQQQPPPVAAPQSSRRTFGDFEYTVSGSAVTIINYTGSVRAVEIPVVIGDLPVTTIGMGAFSNRRRLERVTFPRSVTAIGKSAFSGCTDLERVTLANGVTIIGESAFSGCTRLERIDIPSSVTAIGESAFSGCVRLEQVALANGVTTIGESAFSGCSRLEHITLPDSVTSVGNSAFKDCGRLSASGERDIRRRFGDAVFQ